MDGEFYFFPPMENNIGERMIHPFRFQTFFIHGHIESYVKVNKTEPIYIYRGNG